MNKQCNSYIMGMGHGAWSMNIEHSLLFSYWFCSINLMWCIHNASHSTSQLQRKMKRIFFSYLSYWIIWNSRFHLFDKRLRKIQISICFRGVLFSFFAAIEIVEGNAFKKYEIEWFPVVEQWRCWWCFFYLTWNMNQMRCFTVNKMRIICIMLVEIWIFHFVHGRCSETVMKRDGGWWHHHWDLTKEMHILFSLLFIKCALFYPFFTNEYWIASCCSLFHGKCVFVGEFGFDGKPIRKQTTKMKRNKLQSKFNTFR